MVHSCSTQQVRPPTKHSTTTEYMQAWNVANSKAQEEAPSAELNASRTKTRMSLGQAAVAITQHRPQSCQHLQPTRVKNGEIYFRNCKARKLQTQRPQTWPRNIVPTPNIQFIVQWVCWPLLPTQLKSKAYVEPGWHASMTIWYACLIIA